MGGDPDLVQREALRLAPDGAARDGPEPRQTAPGHFVGRGIRLLVYHGAGKFA